MPFNIPAYLMAKNGNVPVGAEPFDIPAYLMAKAASGGGIKEISGTLPLTVRSRASQVLKNYIIYGTASGAGVETGNEFPFAEAGTFEFGNGTVISDGAGRFTVVTSTNSSVTNSALIPLVKQYTIPLSKAYDGEYIFYVGNSAIRDGLSLVFYDASGNKIENWLCNTAWRTLSNYRDMTGSTIAYIGFNIVAKKSVAEMAITPMFSKNGSLTSYILSGYKLPLKVTANGTTTDYPIYIGDSKLGEEEYVDYAEQKVYKRTDNLFEENTIARNQSINYETGIVFSSQSSYLSDYIDINDAVALSILISNASGITASQANRGWCYFDAQQNFISGIVWVGRTSTSAAFTVNSVPENAKYLRFSIDKNVDVITLVKGSTPPQSHIPYLQPTDPPVPLPDITLPQGIATIDTEEEFKYTTSIKGKIKQIT